MKENQKTYWKGIEELSNDPDFLKNAQSEFPEYLPVKEASGKPADSEGTGRRDFLKLLGFGVAAVSLAACEAPVQKAIPYLNKPVDVEPGIANWYASTFVNGSDYCSVLVKTREGRPIKIEGNGLSSITKGGTSARVQASVLNLYDEGRLKYFVVKGKELAVKKDNTEYTSIDREITKALQSADSKGITILSSSIYSPSTLKVIEQFKEKFPSTKHVMYDAISTYGMRRANQASFGKDVIPSYAFSKAEVIVGFNCDFLGTWISPIEYAKGYSKTRKVSDNNKKMSRHYQFESNMTITGASADYREPIKVSEEAAFLGALYSKITGNSAGTGAPRKSLNLDMAAEDLIKAKGKSLVVSGSNDKNIQILVNEINYALNNYGTTINLSRGCNLKKGNDQELISFVKDAASGKVGAVIFLNCNPAYDLPSGDFEKAIKNIPLKVSFSQKLDETASLCDYVCPGLHYLESWGDAEPYEGYFSMAQPTITPIFKGNRAVEDSLLIWAGKKITFYDFLTDNWEKNIIKSSDNFQNVWNTIVHDGVYEPTGTSPRDSSKLFAISGNITDDTSAVAKQNLVHDLTAPAVTLSEEPVSFTSNISSVGPALTASAQALSGGLELLIYESIQMGDGAMANNPWLQELPDPISKATWDNFVSISYAEAKAMKLIQGQVVSLNVGKYNVKAPVVVQPGQARGVISLALGYGRKKAGVAANDLGVNAFPLVRNSEETFNYTVGKVSLKSTNDFSTIATTQTHDTVMERESVLQEATLAAFQKPDWERSFQPMIHTDEGEVPPGGPKTDLWYQHDKPNHLWGMVVDLNSCIGCGACVVGCIAENNVPIVGKKEVINRREMHWIRIDRYYSSDMTKEKAEKEELGAIDMYDKMEVPSENPEVVFQPMMCQQCNHAPCETVCPVAATTHSSEGLNQMTYNRCIGTRYCANNCPYKVRRFNWFKYFDNDDFDINTSMHTMLGRMVLNPDVTVRSRGVMEKCSFCIQRIQEGKLAAKKEHRRPKDGEIVTACAAACPTDAITFGDYNDSESQVYKQVTEDNNKRSYTVLGEINTRPNVVYLTKIRNKKA